MADSFRNLDDGELWLPSDIFPEEGPSRVSRPPRFPSEFACMEDLAQRFAALALLERRGNQTIVKSPPNLERFATPVRYGSIGSFPAGRLSFDRGFGGVQGRGFHGFGVDGLWAGSRPIYPSQFVNPVQHQVESFMETSARVFQRQQKRLLQNRVLQSRVLPLRVNGYGVAGGGGGGGGGGPVREYGGTGVFLPRISTATNSTTARINSSSINTPADISVRKRQDVVQVIPRRNPLQTFDVGKQEECHYHLPPDTGLPQDWTY